MFSQFYNFTHPQLFQGDGEKPPYFEGWYYRVVSPEGRVLAFIPGVSLTCGDSHSFIQFADSGSRSEPTGYFSYPPEQFIASRQQMLFSVGQSFFSKDYLNIRIDGPRQITGTLRFTNALPLDRSLFSPGIMGPFSFLPMLPCRHEVVTARAGVRGCLVIDGEQVCLDGGTAYIEKDWGQAFPDFYFWAQACDFDGHSSSFMLSAARVMVLNRPMTGVIGYLYAGGRFTRFATYTGARLDSLLKRENGAFVLHLHDERRMLRLLIEPGRSGELLAPMKGAMSRRITECLDAKLELVVRSRCGRVSFQGEAAHAGCELCGEPNHAPRPSFCD